MYQATKSTTHAITKLRFIATSRSAFARASGTPRRRWRSRGGDKNDRSAARSRPCTDPRSAAGILRLDRARAAPRRLAGTAPGTRCAARLKDVGAIREVEKALGARHVPPSGQQHELPPLPGLHSLSCL